MKKIVISAAVVVAVVFGVFQANNNNVQMSELQMENAELLAQGEGYNDHVNCRWDYDKSKCKHSGWEVCLLTDRTWLGCR